MSHTMKIVDFYSYIDAKDYANKLITLSRGSKNNTAP